MLSRFFDAVFFVDVGFFEFADGGLNSRNSGASSTVFSAPRAPPNVPPHRGLVRPHLVGLKDSLEACIPNALREIFRFHVALPQNDRLKYRFQYEIVIPTCSI